MPNTPQQTSNLSKGFVRGDALYFALLFVMATGSTAFPFYVHFNRDQFGPPEMHFYGATQSEEQLQPDSPVYQRNVASQVRPRLELDRITTASIRPRAAVTKKPRLRAPARQQFPEEVQPLVPSFEIMFVTSERLLAIENGRVASFRKGSLLADGSRISRINKTNGIWIVETTVGTKMRWSSTK